MSDTIPETITDVSELIRFLALWCPDTPVEFAHIDNGEPHGILAHEYEADTLTFLIG